MLISISHSNWEQGRRNKNAARVLRKIAFKRYCYLCTRNVYGAVIGIIIQSLKQCMKEGKKAL
jgi:hypothetical protein